MYFLAALQTPYKEDDSMGFRGQNGGVLHIFTLNLVSGFSLLQGSTHSSLQDLLQQVSFSSS